jgi:SnoaL-like domain
MLNQLQYRNIIATVHEFCRAIDRHDWPALRNCLASNLATDYSSFRGTPPGRMTADEFVALRKSALAGLVTQHLSMNHLVTLTAADGAICRFDFVIHRWPRDTGDLRYFHTYGYYEFVLHHSPEAPHKWVISSITQHALRSEGSKELHKAFPATNNQGPIG